MFTQQFKLKATIFLLLETFAQHYLALPPNPRQGQCHSSLAQRSQHRTASKRSAHQIRQRLYRRRQRDEAQRARPNKDKNGKETQDPEAQFKTQRDAGWLDVHRL